MLTHRKFQNLGTLICQWVQRSTAGIGHWYLEQQLRKQKHKTFASPSRVTNEKGKENKKQERLLQYALRYTQTQWI